MKTHILITAFAAFLLTACASHEGRSISSTAEDTNSHIERAKVDGLTGRPVGPN